MKKILCVSLLFVCTNIHIWYIIMNVVMSFSCYCLVKNKTSNKTNWKTQAYAHPTYTEWIPSAKVNKKKIVIMSYITLFCCKKCRVLADKKKHIYYAWINIYIIRFQLWKIHIVLRRRPQASKKKTVNSYLLLRIGIILLFHLKSFWYWQIFLQLQIVQILKIGPIYFILTNHKKVVMHFAIYQNYLNLLK